MAKRVWNPPLLYTLSAGVTDSGTATNLLDDRYEGGSTNPARVHTNANYRMPRSGEPIGDPNPWQM